MQLPHSTAIIDGQFINIPTMKPALDVCVQRLSAGQGFSFLTLNLDHLVQRRRYSRFRDAYACATFVCADGQPIVKLAKLQGVELERTTGADLVQPLCIAAATINAPVYLFGTDDETLDIAKTQLCQAIPTLIIAGFSAPEFGFDPDSEQAENYAQSISQSGARLCFVALPALKATYFIDRFAAQYPHIGFIGVGAALDFIAGKHSRAPKFVQSLGLEWAWRLVTHPSLFKRYLACVILYLQLRMAA